MVPVSGKRTLPRQPNVSVDLSTLYLCYTNFSLFANTNLMHNRPYNEWPGSPWSPSPDSRVMEFQEELKRANVFSTIRWPRGRDILAACGQLNSASDIS